MRYLQLEAWRRISADPEVLKWIEDGVPMQFHQNPCSVRLGNHIRDNKLDRQIQVELDELLQWGAIKEVSEGELHCVLPLQVAAKRMEGCALFWTADI